MEDNIDEYKKINNETFVNEVNLTLHMDGTLTYNVQGKHAKIEPTLNSLYLTLLIYYYLVNSDPIIYPEDISVKLKLGVKLPNSSDYHEEIVTTFKQVIEFFLKSSELYKFLLPTALINVAAWPYLLLHMRKVRESMIKLEFFGHDTLKTHLTNVFHS